MAQRARCVGPGIHFDSFELAGVAKLSQSAVEPARLLPQFQLNSTQSPSLCVNDSETPFPC